MECHGIELPIRATEDAVRALRRPACGGADVASPACSTASRSSSALRTSSANGWSSITRRRTSAWWATGRRTRASHRSDGPTPCARRCAWLDPRAGPLDRRRTPHAAVHATQEPPLERRKRRARGRARGRGPHDRGRTAGVRRTRHEQEPYSTSKGPSRLSPEFDERLRRDHPQAAAFWDSTPPSYRKIRAFWISEAKRPETRERRFGLLVEASPRANGSSSPPVRAEGSRPMYLAPELLIRRAREDTRKRHNSQRARLPFPQTGSSVKSLPDPTPTLRPLSRSVQRAGPQPP